MYSLSVEEEGVVDDDAAENMKEDEEGRGWGGERKALSDDATDDAAEFDPWLVEPPIAFKRTDMKRHMPKT